MTIDAARGPCIDAETLAAWVDQGLTAAEADRVELHLSNCERCQSVLAALAQATPAVAGLAPVLPFWSRRPVRWASVGLAAAASLMLWVWTDLPTSLPVPEATVAVNQPLPAPLPERPLEPERPSENVPPPMTIPPPVPAPETPARPAQARPTPARPTTTPSVGLPAPPPPPAIQASPPPPPPASPPPPPPVKTTEEVTVSAAAPVVNSKLARVGLESRGSASPEKQVAWRIVGAGAQALAANPSKAPWQIADHAVLMHSNDKGETWMPVPLDGATELTAFSAPTDLICWVVGPQGAVYLTVDGATSKKIPFPESVRLTAVVATSGTEAIVTTVDGRTFTTIDGGKTWRE